MFKAIASLALLGFATTTSAAETIEVDIFAAQNFVSLTTPGNLMKGLIDAASGRTV